MFDVIAFDADDTLWHNEHLYRGVEARFEQLLAPYCSEECTAQRLHETEIANLGAYGYGIKGFALSLIETAIEVTGGRITGAEIGKVLELARGMLSAEVQLLEHAREVVKDLAASYPLMLITKGDLIDQEAKLARSGLGPYFRYVEVVTDKTRDIYAALLAQHDLAPERFLMVGNSLRSDILPVLELGGQAVYIPYATTWAHECVYPGEMQGCYHELEHLGLLPGFIRELAGFGG